MGAESSLMVPVVREEVGGVSKMAGGELAFELERSDCRRVGDFLTLIGEEGGLIRLGEGGALVRFRESVRVSVRESLRLSVRDSVREPERESLRESPRGSASRNGEAAPPVRL